MESLRRLRELADETAVPDAERMSVVRARLVSRFGRRALRGGVGRFVPLIVSGTAVVVITAVAIGGALIARGTGALAPSVTATVPAAGEHLRIEETREWYEPCDADGSGLTGTWDEADAVYRVRQTRVLLIPGDEDAPFVWQSGSDDVETERIATTLADSEACPENLDSAETATDPSSAMPSDVPLPDPLLADDPNGDLFFLLDPLREEYAQMPRDPTELLTWMREHLSEYELGEGVVADTEAMAVPDDTRLLRVMADAAAQNQLPTDLREPWLEALSRLDGVTAEREDGAISRVTIRADDVGQTDLPLERQTVLTVTPETRLVQLAETVADDPSIWGGDASAPSAELSALLPDGLDVTETTRTIAATIVTG